MVECGSVLSPPHSPFARSKGVCMKQSISAPVAIVIVVVVLSGIGFFLYKQYLAPSGDVKPFTPNMAPMNEPPKTREEGMKMYRGGN